MKNTSKTDWARIHKMSDADIDFSDIPETPEDFWQDAEWFMPPSKDSLIQVLQPYKLKSTDMKMVVRLVERLAVQYSTAPMTQKSKSKDRTALSH